MSSQTDPPVSGSVAAVDEFTTYTLARAVHVVGVVLWIGGVAFVTTVLIPALRNSVDAPARLERFETLESRFATQAKIVTVVTGASGFYMLHVMNAWHRYLDPQYWWIHLMTLVWIAFTLVLFVFEPLFLHRWFHERASVDGEGAFMWLQRMHVLMLTLSLIAILGAVAGAHGLMFR